MSTLNELTLDPPVRAPREATAPPVKCVVWDLDHTLWDGVLSEGDDVALRPGALAALQALDARGILSAIASKNDHDDAMQRLERLGVADYFLYPQIDWAPKSEGVSRIRQALNIGEDTLLFIDDQPFERDEVHALHPQVECVDATELHRLLEHPRIRGVAATREAARRRQMYLEDMARQRHEQRHGGTPESFLATLEMRFAIARATEADLQRAEELTVRTNQLNATGISYGAEELRGFMASPRHSLLVCELSDRYGSYGTIGLALVEHLDRHDHIRLLLMSCRIVSRGVGSVLITHLMKRAAAAGKTLQADFRRSPRNRQMLVTYQFSGFRELQRGADGQILFEHTLQHVPDFPAYIQIRTAP